MTLGPFWSQSEDSGTGVLLIEGTTNETGGKIAENREDRVFDGIWLLLLDSLPDTYIRPHTVFTRLSATPE